MGLPDRIATRSVRRDIPQIVPVTKKMVQLERRAAQEIVIRDIENRTRQLCADTDMAMNAALVDDHFKRGMSFYEENLSRVSTTAVGQQMLAEDVELLAALNQSVVLRYAR